MTLTLITVLGGVIAGVVTAAGYILIAKIQAKADAAKSNQIAKIDELAEVWKQYNVIEDRVAKLETAFRASATFIDRIGVWLQAGGKPPPPTPPAALLGHIDEELWTIRLDERGDNASRH